MQGFKLFQCTYVFVSCGTMFSFEHVYIVFYVLMNSSRVHGRHDVWVIRIYAQCHDVLRPSVWSDDQIEIES